ncbi:MAG: hypothetical protein KME16_23065 [Scytolyngbya sp. HA4215-MV1]|jgi:hypothetical protein|nr:hypothetical protein [Scytolyngbya sp. HA4215-MV1]
MKLIRRIATGLLLLFGLPISIYGSIALMDRNLAPKDREGTLAAIIIFGLPATALGSWLAWGLYAQSQQEKAAQAQERREQLQATFYQLLQENDGEISLLRLAAATGISGEEAKVFLDERAKEFSADFGVSDRGDIFYRFPL